MLIKRFVHTLMFAILSLFSAEVLGDEPTYTKTTSLPPLRITYDELQSVLDKSSKLIAAANASLPTDDFSERSQLKHAESQIEIPGHQLRGSGVKLPQFATELRYTATHYPRKSAPIATVSMIFYDNDRRLEVEGSSPEQVDAVFAALKGDFLNVSSPMGGSTFRFFSGYVLFVICSLVAVFSFLKWIGTKDHRAILPTLFALLGIYLLFALPFEEFLAGFSVSEFDPSFASRYGPELALAGLILTIAAIPLSYLLPKWFEKRSESSSPIQPSTPNPTLKGTRRKRRAP